MSDISILAIQVIGIFFSLLLIYLTFIRFKQNLFTARECLIWTAIWGMFLLTAIFPSLFDPLIKGLHFARGLDFFIVIGFFLFTGIIFYIYAIMRSVQRKLETLVREISFLKQK